MPVGPPPWVLLHSKELGLWVGDLCIQKCEQPKSSPTGPLPDIPLSCDSSEFSRSEGSCSLRRDCRGGLGCLAGLPFPCLAGDFQRPRLLGAPGCWSGRAYEESRGLSGGASAQGACGDSGSPFLGPRDVP